MVAPRKPNIPAKIVEEDETGDEHGHGRGYYDNNSDDEAMSSTKESSADEEDRRSNAIASKETERVFVSRIVFVCSLLLAATAVGLCAYFLTSQEEEDQFDDTFQSLAQELIQVSQVNANNKFQALKSLSLSMTTMSIAGNSVWPLITHPNFEAEAGHIRRLLGALWVAMVPIVREDDRADWENYTVANQGWIKNSFDYRKQYDVELTPIKEFIFRRHFGNGSEYRDNVPFEPDLPFYMPAWQTSEVLPNAPNINLNVLSDPFFKKVFLEVKRTDGAVLSEAFNYSLYLDAGKLPESYLLQPLYKEFETQDESTLAGVVAAFVPWNYFENILSTDAAGGVYVVLKNPCGSTFSFLIEGPDVTFLGADDLHDRRFDSMEIVANATEIRTPANCRYAMHLYPSKQLEDHFRTKMPWILALAGVGIFFVTGIVFMVYNRLVEERQDRVMETANRSGAIVDSLYPPAIRDRLMNDEAMKSTFGGGGGGDDMSVGSATNHQSNSKKLFGIPFIGQSKVSKMHTDALNNSLNFPSQHGESGKGGDAPSNTISVFPTKPIADYYPEGTILIADLVGFAAWSSVREPSQVFHLLETLYNQFDKIGKKRKVFKVETLGDCYVAAGGIPTPMADHAVVMAIFARDCKRAMREVVRQLEVWLGPDTADLSIRLALHSGPVTAGVLRGEKSRFQLFGETVDNAFILESHGSRNKIHVSSATAELLRSAGKDHWLTARTNKVVMKGKVETQTYWLDIKNKSKIRSTNKTDQTDAMSTTSSQHRLLADMGLDNMHDATRANQNATDQVDGAGTSKGRTNDNRRERLVEWATDILARLLKTVVASRDSNLDTAVPQKKHSQTGGDVPFMTNNNPLDEVKEIIKLRTDMVVTSCDPAQVDLPFAVEQQLRDYVSIVSNLYRDNHFHSFEHACHVTQAVTKLISRVVTSDEIDTSTMLYKQKAGARDLHTYTFGITSDPLIQFSCALSALIHDVDHPGVPNSQLVKENSKIATLYANKSVAEQNSVDLAWNVLMEPSFEELRKCIYSNEDELFRFRQLVINSVMATDIVDKELGYLRKARWNKAFNADAALASNAYSDESIYESEEDKVNRKATIVIEHVVQAADVSHMMQHWHIYLKWNERFFQECYRAFLDGRADKDPSAGWYKGELGFYDFYIIPLAKKLKDCGCFGVSSDEFLNYAIANRATWESKGKDIVDAYMKNFQHKQQQGSSSGSSASAAPVE